MVVYRYRQDLLCLLLADHVFIEDGADLVRRGQVGLGRLAPLIRCAFLADDVIAQLDALVADEYRRTGNQLAHLVLALSTERAVEKLFDA